MNELGKTLLVLLMCVALVLWVVFGSFDKSRPRPQDQLQTMLVDIEKPGDVAALKIVSFDSKTGKQERFAISKGKSGYVIASRFDYPADAKDHLEYAANSVNKLKIVSVAGEGNLAVEDFGVVDPESRELKTGSNQAGMRVTLEDAQGHSLADFIIGPEVEGSNVKRTEKPDEEEDKDKPDFESKPKKPKDKTQLRYVRLADRDQVYQVEIDTQFLSTQFDDWIEKDLLKLDPIDVKQVAMADYTPAMGPQGGVMRDNRSFVEVNYDGQALKWDLDKWLTYKNDQAQPQKLSADQELNQGKLDDLKAALDELKIANVEPKPKGLQGGAEKILRDPELLGSLVKKGFYPAAVTTDPETGQNLLELIGEQGDVVARLSNGVEYTLRFGRVSGGESKDAKTEEKKEDKPADKLAPGQPPVPDAAPKLLRYLYIAARFDENLIPKPELEALPELEAAKPQEPVKKDEPKADGAAKDGEKKEEKPAAETKADVKKPDAKQDDPKKNDVKGVPGQKEPEKKATEAKEPEKKDTAKKESAEKDTAKKEPEKKAPEAKAEPAKDAGKEAGKTAADAKPAADPNAKEPEKKKEEPKLSPEELKQRRADIIKLNAVRQKAYNDQVAAGKKKVAELNKRFNVWYYIIADETYQKLHLSDKDVIQKKPPKDASPHGPQGFGPGAHGPLPNIDPGSFVPKP